MCTSKGGNPLAQVYWYKNDAEIDFSYTSGGDKSVNELVFTVQPNDNEAVYRCEASNLVTSTPLTAEVKLIVECEYFAFPYIHSIMLFSSPCWINVILFKV